jgi:DNA-binding transcriptional LysR family regulator
MPRAADLVGLLQLGVVMALEDEATLPEDPGLSWSQLTAFIACSRHHSFNAAAAALALTSSAVRYQIGLLEHRLGGRLFERHAGTLVPTDLGVSFAQSRRSHARVDGSLRGRLVSALAAQASASG